MSTVKIEESFELDAPADQAWSYLIEPERIVVCLPGAQLTEVLDERNYAGNIKVKVGAVSMAYEGQIEFTEVDHDARVIRMVGKGRAKGGGGTATLTMDSTVLELAGGRSRVSINADIRLTGTIVRFGRGMIEAVSKELFKEFTARLAAELASAEVEPEASSVAEPELGRAAPSEAEPEALALLPLLARALRSWLKRLFGRS